MLKPYTKDVNVNDERKVPCHALPMHEYTHTKEGKQLVQVIVKQEWLRDIASLAKATG